MPKVYNKRAKDIPAAAVPVDRSTDWGNPFIIGKHGDRTMVLKKFSYYANKRLKEEPEWLDPLIGKDLVCWCSPEACHADVLLRMAYERKIELAILSIVSDEWLTIPEIKSEVAIKMEVAPETLGDIIAHRTGVLVRESKLENKVVTPEDSEGYYYMLRKAQPKGD